MNSDRALATLAARAVEVTDMVRVMRNISTDLPAEIRIEVNNLQEVLDFLRFKLREETLHRAVHRSPAPAKRRARS